MLRFATATLLLFSLLLTMNGCLDSNSDPTPPNDSETSAKPVSTKPSDSEAKADSKKPLRRRFTKNGVEYLEYSVERKDYHHPPLKLSLQDDKVDRRLVPDFDPTLVHPDPLNGSELNLSRTVFQLDTPVPKPDRDARYIKLRPSYIDAVAVGGSVVLPSVNLIDGKAKQFDDGLYAALDLAYYSGHQDVLRSHVDLIHQIARKVESDSAAAPYLAAGLELAGVSLPVNDQDAKAKYLQEFENNSLRSKPLGFYNWSPELAECYQFLKYFQQPFWITDSSFPNIPRELASVVQNDPQLRADYQQAVSFYAKLTNPLIALNLLDVSDDVEPQVLAEQQLAKHMHPGVSVFPASTSKEQRLFDRLFPLGFPEGADLMQELIRAVQQGKVDLAPHPDSGWYDYQSYALETFLLPNQGEESCKLILSARYKQRMLDAFAALITKRRETHIRQLSSAGETAAAPPDDWKPPNRLAPRLRLEPNATYYLRTARAYSFLQSFLNEAVGADFLREIKGLREGGTRETNLADELEGQKTLFYGFYLLCMEDVGLSPALIDGEVESSGQARKRALAWLKKFKDDPDLGVDTRVVVPVAVNPLRGTTQLWGTAGVRLVRLEVKFAQQFIPSIRAAGSDDAWQKFEGQIETTNYFIPVEEFIAVEVSRLDCPTRAEFRKLCDQAETKEELIRLLQNP